MDGIIDFIVANPIWVIVGIVLIIMLIVGYIADKTDFGHKKAQPKQPENNTENVVVLNQGLEFQESSSSSVEMQLNQNKKTLADEINDIFHIHKNDFDLTFKEAIYPIVRAFGSNFEVI